MEDDTGLDLSLFLPYNGQATSIEGKGIGSESRAEKADSGCKLIDDFKNFLHGGNQKEDSVVGSQRCNQVKLEENLFYDLSRSTANVDASSYNNGRGFWGKNDNGSAEVQEVRQETGSKRKNLFDEINHQKRHERDSHIVDLVAKTRTPYIPVTTDEGSTAENEVVADSEAEGLTSKLVGDSEKHIGNFGLYEGKKDVNGVSNSSGTHLQEGLRRFSESSEKELKFGNLSYGVPFSGQSVNVVNMTYPLSMKESNSNSVSGVIKSGYNTSGMIQVMAPESKDRPGTPQPIIPATLPLIFGYSQVQMPTLDPVNKLKSYEEGSSSHTGGGITKSADTQARAEGCLPEHPNITPGIGAELKFGGSGSSPDLPWVSTTGPGPNGKTISGVTYKHNGTQVRVVCACHGSHFSVEEFVQHASDKQPSRANEGSVLASSNPAASAQS